MKAHQEPVGDDRIHQPHGKASGNIRGDEKEQFSSLFGGALFRRLSGEIERGSGGRSLRGEAGDQKKARQGGDEKPRHAEMEGVFRRHCHFPGQKRPGPHAGKPQGHGVAKVKKGRLGRGKAGKQDLLRRAPRSRGAVGPLSGPGQEEDQPQGQGGGVEKKGQGGQAPGQLARHQESAGGTPVGEGTHRKGQEKVGQKPSRQGSPQGEARPSQGMEGGEECHGEIALGHPPESSGPPEKRRDRSRRDHRMSEAGGVNRASGAPRAPVVRISPAEGEAFPERPRARYRSTSRTTRSTEREARQTLSPPQGGRGAW